MKEFDLLVAGHVCLDVIPTLPNRIEFHPGILVEAGAATISPGGAVSNVGVISSRLGLKTRMVAKIGEDSFGNILLDLLAKNAPEASHSIKIDPNQNTSYTIVLNLFGQDRMFLHSPGANQTFRSRDVTDEELVSARHLHFGYPPLMRDMYRDEGAELMDLFKRAKAEGLTTSLDLSLPDKDAESGQVDWTAILSNTLPYVDYFMPSVHELTYMLDRTKFNRLKDHEFMDIENVRELAARARELGAERICLKRGDRGLFYRSGALELTRPCFQVDVVGTTGTGDATIAGFLCGIFEGKTIEQAMTLACQVGALCCEAADSTSGVPDRAGVQNALPKLVSASVGCNISRALDGHFFPD